MAVAVGRGGARAPNAKVKSGTSARREHAPWLQQPILVLQCVLREGWLRLHPRLFLEAEELGSSRQENTGNELNRVYEEECAVQGIFYCPLRGQTLAQMFAAVCGYTLTRLQPGLTARMPSCGVVTNTTFGSLRNDT